MQMRPCHLRQYQMRHPYLEHQLLLHQRLQHRLLQHQLLLQQMLRYNTTIWRTEWRGNAYTKMVPSGVKQPGSQIIRRQSSINVKSTDVAGAPHSELIVFASNQKTKDLLRVSKTPCVRRVCAR